MLDSADRESFHHHRQFSWTALGKRKEDSHYVGAWLVLTRICSIPTWYHRPRTTEVSAAKIYFSFMWTPLWDWTAGEETARGSHFSCSIGQIWSQQPCFPAKGLHISLFCVPTEHGSLVSRFIIIPSLHRRSRAQRGQIMCPRLTSKGVLGKVPGTSEPSCKVSSLLSYADVSHAHWEVTKRVWGFGKPVLTTAKNLEEAQGHGAWLKG